MEHNFIQWIDCAVAALNSQVSVLMSVFCPGRKAANVSCELAPMLIVPRPSIPSLVGATSLLVTAAYFENGLSVN